MFCFLGGCIVTRFCQWCSFKFECMQHKMYRSHHFTLICFIFTFVCGLAWFPYTHMWATIIVNSIIRYTCEYVSIRTTSRIQLEHWHLWHQNLRNGSLDLSELLWLGLNSQQVVFFFPDLGKCVVKSLADWNESRSRWGQLYSVNLKVVVGSPKTS